MTEENANESAGEIEMKQVKRKSPPTLFPGRIIRERRLRAGLKAVEVAKLARINVRTLNAIEMGRIVSPSLHHLHVISKVLGISMGALFSELVRDEERMFYLGDQKGAHALEFPKEGFRIICFTPFGASFFMGKVILKGGGHMGPKQLPLKGMTIVQPMIGKLNFTFDGRDHLVREGNYVFFDANLPFELSNSLQREVIFLLITVPSFLTRSS